MSRFDCCFIHIDQDVMACRYKQKCRKLEDQLDELQDEQIQGLDKSMHEAEQERATLRKQWRDEVSGVSITVSVCLLRYNPSSGLLFIIIQWQVLDGSSGAV